MDTVDCLALVFSQSINCTVVLTTMILHFMLEKVWFVVSSMPADALAAWNFETFNRYNIDHSHAMCVSSAHCLRIIMNIKISIHISRCSLVTHIWWDRSRSTLAQIMAWVESSLPEPWIWEHFCRWLAIHFENSPVTQTMPEPTLLSWGSWPRDKFPPLPPGHTASPVLSRSYHAFHATQTLLFSGSLISTLHIELKVEWNF